MTLDFLRLLNLHGETVARLDRLERMREQDADVLRVIAHGLHYVMERLPNMDRAALKTLAQSVESKLDAAASRVVAQASAHSDQLDDVGSILTDMGSKADKIAPDTAASGSTSGTDGSLFGALSKGSTLTAAAPAGASVITVDPDQAPATGAVLDHPSLSSGTTVVSSNGSTGDVVLSAPTTAPIEEGDKVAVKAAA